MKYKPINGWTKSKILEVINAREFEGPAIDKLTGDCCYLAPNGNKCAVGLFIPDRHHGQGFIGSVTKLLKYYPDLKDVMPLDQYALERLQGIHDKTNPRYKADIDYNGNAKQAMLDWGQENVE